MTVVDIKGNELADKAAKEGRTACMFDREIDCHVEDWMCGNTSMGTIIWDCYFMAALKKVNLL